MSGGEQLITEVITNQDRDMSVTMFTAPQVWPPVLSLHCCQCQWSHPGGWGQWQGDNHSDTRRGELRPGAGEPWPIRGLESSWSMCVFQVPGQGRGSWLWTRSMSSPARPSWVTLLTSWSPRTWPAHQEAHALEGDRGRHREALLPPGLSAQLQGHLYKFQRGLDRQVRIIESWNISFGLMPSDRMSGKQ